MSLKFLLYNFDMFEKFKNLTLLYIDDEEHILESASEYLSRLFKSVYTAKNGFEALKVYNSNRPDIIISDIKMPKMDGLEFVSKVREFDGNTPIIVATAYTDTELLLKAVELQLVKYLIKPLNKKSLLEALELSLSKNKIVTLNKNIVYDPLNKALFIDKENIKLTKNELMLLDLLVKNRDRVTSYEEIKSYIWKYDVISSDALRTLVKQIRKKLKDDIIKTYSGLGYKIETKS